MKKTLSFILTLIMVLSSLTLPISACAATKVHVEDAMLYLETQRGYIPGNTAAVTGNCYGFVSSVCQKLYGVTYYYEQFNGTYQFVHGTGNYYTVGVATYAKPSTSLEWATSAAAIKDFIINNAAEGDVIQYGCANNSTTHKHTAIIQHIDSEKMQIFHSNYAAGNYSAASCHVDTIYWSSFLTTPNGNTKDSAGNIISLNKFFGAPLDCSNGLGISINRYSKLENLYYLDMAVMPAPVVKSERKSSTSIAFSWNKIDGASSYGYYVTDANGAIICNDNFTTNLTVTIGGLVTGQTYNFVVYAVNASDNGQSGVKTVQCLPPAPSKPSVTTVDSNGISISWAKRSDISGCVVLRSTSGGAFAPIAYVDTPSACSYTDTSVANNTAYTYKVQRYVNTNSGIYYSGKSSSTDAFAVTLDAPANVKASNKTSTSIKLTWDAVSNATSYTVSYRVKGAKSWKSVSASSNSQVVSGLKMKNTYSLRVKANNAFGSSTYSKTVNKKQLPPTPSSVKAKKKGKSVVISWAKSSGFDGYYIVRSTSKSFNKNVKKIKIKSNSKLSYTDKTTKKGKTYYYKVCRYKGKTSGNYSSKVKVKL